MTLPELHGWLPASALARREGVAPSTIRRRAARGELEAIPNPLGAGSLYRHRGANPDAEPRGASPGFLAVTPPHSGRTTTLHGTDRLALGLLPTSVTGMATELGVSPGTASRALTRLARAGLARAAETIPPRTTGRQTPPRLAVGVTPPVPGERCPACDWFTEQGHACPCGRG